jgi:hypothetical protein
MTSVSRLTVTVWSRGWWDLAHYTVVGFFKDLQSAGRLIGRASFDARSPVISFLHE